jgi:signal transduction histidine kinase/CheY-like chemotaxis protein
MKYIKVVLSIMIVVVFGYIIIGEFAFPNNTPRNGFLCYQFPTDNWYIITDDGKKEPFELPGKAEGDIILETTIPEEIDKDANAMCFRGMDMQIYVDDKLREEYITQDYELLGDRSAECYVMASLYPEDAGKTLRVYYEYNSGVVYEAYYGTRIGIWAHFFSLYGAELFVGIMIMALGIICYVSSTVYRLIYKQYLEMQHLSIGVLLGGCWVMSNSIFRQFYTRNISVMSDIPFLMVMLMPIPFIVFIDSLQEQRYTKLLTAAGIIDILDFVVLIVLFISGNMALTRSFNAAAGCAVINIVIISYTIIKDASRGLMESYIYVAVGFIVLGIAASGQIIAYIYAHNGVFSGFLMSLGLLGFLICSAIHTIKQLIGIRLSANEAMHASIAKDQFLANMSHEIRTPLNGILGMDEMIIRDSRDSKVKKYALDIRSAGNTLLSLINDILDLSKIEAGSFEIIPVEYSTASVFNDVLNMTRHKAIAKDIDFIFNVAPEIPCELLGDEIRVRQVMLNVINNAIKYTDKGKVKISIFARSDRSADTDENGIVLYIKVEDTGRGIRKEDMEKLFTSFQRLDEKKNRNIEGTGLGLHITQKLVELMGGTIDVESIYGEGSTFTISIPQIVVKADPIGDFGNAVDKFINSMEIDKTSLYVPDAKILVVDDNEMNIDVLIGLLSDTRIRIATADSGPVCIERVRADKYDCILLDQMMPGMNGEETLKNMKDMDILHGTPVIALTADAIMGAKEGYISKGFTDYLSKPIKYDKLEELLKKYIPEEKQLELKPQNEGLPTMLIWGTDADRIRNAKENLSDHYKCTCVVGTKAMEKYLEKHSPDAVLHII